jgi:hypothetical protein
MSEPKKQRMDPARFIEIFSRYSFEEKGEVLSKLKSIYKDNGAELREKLEKELQEIENKIS